MPLPDAQRGIVADARGRRIDYLRVSLTDRCNFRCRYCMPPEGIRKLRHEEMLTLEELTALVRLMVTDLGIRKVRVTGGEPLVRRGVLGFLAGVGAIPGLADLSLTTNGYHLAAMAEGIWQAGVRRLNVSLDTLRAERFAHLTRCDGLAQVLRGIAVARARGFDPIKINVVSLRETLDEARDLVRFGMENGLQVRFIELMPSPGARDVTFVPNSEIRRAIEAEYALTPVPEPTCTSAGSDPATGGGAASGPCDGLPRSAFNGGPPPGAARLYRIAGSSAVCGFISPITQPFCARCNRIRLRGDGQLLPCLSVDTGYDLMPYVRPEWRGPELVRYLRELLPRSKAQAPARHAIRAMSRIGG